MSAEIATEMSAEIAHLVPDAADKCLPLSSQYA